MHFDEIKSKPIKLLFLLQREPALKEDLADELYGPDEPEGIAKLNYTIKNLSRCSGWKLIADEETVALSEKDYKLIQTYYNIYMAKQYKNMLKTTNKGKIKKAIKELGL